MDILHTIKPKDVLPKLWREHRLTQFKISFNIFSHTSTSFWLTQTNIS